MHSVHFGICPHVCPEMVDSLFWDFESSDPFFSVCVRVFSLHVCMRMPGALSGGKRALDPVELQLGVVMNHSVSGGTQALVLCKEKKMLLTPEPCLQPRLFVFKFG